MLSFLFYGLGLIVLALVVLWLLGLRLVPNNRIGVVEKLWAREGSLQNQIIALQGEAGYQPEVLRGGLHFLFRLQYRVHIFPLVTVPQGQIAYVFARDGRPLKPAQTLGKVVSKGGTFQDVRGFFQGGGQRGPQRQIIREGSYAFNLAQFVIITQDRLHGLIMSKGEKAMLEKMAQVLQERNGFSPVVIHGSDDEIGVVTVHDGPSLPEGDIIAPVVGSDPEVAANNHNNFQDPESFLAAGGYRGRQHQVVVEGTYYINRLFATVERIQKTIIDVGFVGVVISYIGSKGEDSSGKDYKHGELVSITSKGVWSQALLPGKYAFNTFAGKVVTVPTTNIVLKWVSGEAGGHKYDENLMAVDLITKDAFEPSLPLSVVIHIDYRKAPKVIQRFGDIRKLVEQTLDPMVSAYFKNIGQQKNLIQLIQERSEIQRMSSEEMRERFAHYDLELEEVLIGTPVPSARDKRIEVILAQLRDRQIAVEQVETYTMQEQAARKERELRDAAARALQQTGLTESEILITIKENQGKAEYQRSLQDAEKIKVLARAEAEKEARVGIGKAIAVEEQVKAYGGPRYQVLQQVVNRFSEAVEKAGVEIVPRFVMSGGGGPDGGERGHSAFEALIALLLDEKLETGWEQSKESPEGQNEGKKIKEQVLAEIRQEANQAKEKKSPRVPGPNVKESTSKRLPKA